MIRNLKKSVQYQNDNPASNQDDKKTTITAEGVEYAIYIHHPANDDRTRSWERAKTTHCRTSALREARELYSSRKYAKVEIKRNIFDRVQNKRLGHTVAVFGDDRKHRPSRNKMLIMIYMAMALLAATLVLTLITAA